MPKCFRTDSKSSKYLRTGLKLEFINKGKDTLIRELREVWTKPVPCPPNQYLHPIFSKKKKFVNVTGPVVLNKIRETHTANVFLSLGSDFTNSVSFITP